MLLMAMNSRCLAHLAYGTLKGQQPTDSEHAHSQCQNARGTRAIDFAHNHGRGQQAWALAGSQPPGELTVTQWVAERLRQQAKRTCQQHMA